MLTLIAEIDEFKGAWRALGTVADLFLRALQQQERRLAAKVERERVVIAALPKLAIQIIDYVRQHGRVTMADMIRVTGVSRNTLKDHFRSLVEKSHLAWHGTGKGSWYSLP